MNRGREEMRLLLGMAGVVLVTITLLLSQLLVAYPALGDR